MGEGPFVAGISLMWNVDLPVAFLVRCSQSTGMVLSFFWSGGLPPYYAPVIAILNSKGRFDQKTTSFKANVPNMNFFCKVPNEKS